jgi:signal transduction histidine kinase
LNERQLRCGSFGSGQAWPPYTPLTDPEPVFTDFPLLGPLATSKFQTLAFFFWSDCPLSPGRSPLHKVKKIRSLSGTRLLVLFLLVTLGLSLWLGFQALRAASSHRETAEGVLTDYADMAAREYSRRIEQRLRRFNQDLFDDIPRTLYRRVPDPEVMENDLYDYALRSQDCRCEALRDGVRFFRVNLQDQSVVTGSDGLSQVVRDRLSDEVVSHRESHPELRRALVSFPEGTLLDIPALMVYTVVRTRDSGESYVFGILAGAHTFEDLFSTWFSQESLLPPTIALSQPNDSLLQVSVRASEATVIFESSTLFPDVAFVQDTLTSELGSLVVKTGIRQDAASHLIIGGLPKERIPFLLGLIFITLGVGTAGLLQIRREHQLAKLRDDFISSVSHEFRTPLTQIQVFADLLDSGRLLTEEKRKWSTGVIKREASRLTHLVANILQFSHSKRTGFHSGVVEEIPLGPALEEVTDAFLPQAESRQAEIRTAIPAGLSVLATQAGLHRILANILENALKYGPVGQTVEVRAEALEGRARVFVEDEGPGIPPSHREKIFQPYFRSEQDLNGNVQGSGIGLALVAEIAEEFHGRVWVEDGEGGGARFVVELPQAGKDEGAKSYV